MFALGLEWRMWREPGSKSSKFIRWSGRASDRPSGYVAAVGWGTCCQIQLAGFRKLVEDSISSQRSGSKYSVYTSYTKMASRATTSTNPEHPSPNTQRRADRQWRSTGPPKIPHGECRTDPGSAGSKRSGAGAWVLQHRTRSKSIWVDTWTLPWFSNKTTLQLMCKICVQRRIRLGFCILPKWSKVKYQGDQRCPLLYMQRSRNCKCFFWPVCRHQRSRTMFGSLVPNVLAWSFQGCRSHRTICEAEKFALCVSICDICEGKQKLALSVKGCVELDIYCVRLEGSHWIRSHQHVRLCTSACACESMTKDGKKYLEPTNCRKALNIQLWMTYSFLFTSLFWICSLDLLMSHATWFILCPGSPA